MTLEDLDPRIRTFLHLRERIFSTHWRLRLGAHPEREFNQTWRAQCDREWRAACEALDSYVYWNFPLPAGTAYVLTKHCLFCHGANLGKGKYCSASCRAQAWNKAHPERVKASASRHQSTRKQRLTLVPQKSA